MEAPCERGTFLRIQVYERVRVSLVKGYERVGKSAIAVCESRRDTFSLLHEWYPGNSKSVLP